MSSRKRSCSNILPYIFALYRRNQYKIKKIFRWTVTLMLQNALLHCFARFIISEIVPRLPGSCVHLNRFVIEFLIDYLRWVWKESTLSFFLPCGDDYVWRRLLFIYGNAGGPSVAVVCWSLLNRWSPLSLVSFRCFVWFKLFPSHNPRQTVGCAGFFSNLH